MSARDIAHNALMRVELDAAHLDRVLDGAFRRTNPTPEDRALATELSYAVLRHRVFLDRWIELLTKRSVYDIDPPTKTSLRLGVAQLTLLDRIPPHAAVFETVELQKRVRKSAVGLVNAALRSYLDPKRQPAPPAPKDPEDAMVLAANAPPWLCKELRKECVRLNIDPLPVLASLCTRAHPTLRVLSRRAKRDEILKKLLDLGIDARPTEQSPHGIAVSRAGDVSELEGFGHEFIAQDEAAQLVGQLAHGEHGPAFDACAAPGGKTLCMWDHGIEPLTAMDVHEGRLSLVTRTAEKAEIKVTTLQGTAEQPPFPPNSFATVMLDAPCTGSGTLRRHPDLKWRLTREDIARLATLQATMLDSCAPLLKPGGALIYAVCSVFSAEGHEQVAKFLERTPGFALEASVETLPFAKDMDGFYAARLRRR